MKCEDDHNLENVREPLVELDFTFDDKNINRINPESSKQQWAPMKQLKTVMHYQLIGVIIVRIWNSILQGNNNKDINSLIKY